MKNSFYSSSNLITNFKPFILQNCLNYNFFKKNKKQLFCKNFLIYILLFKYKSKVFTKSSIFIKKYKKNTHTILRSPYRHKLARHQLFLQRYNINFSIWINTAKTVNIKNFKNLIMLINFLKKFSNIFESNIIYINKIKYNISICYKNNFFLKNFYNNIKNK